MLEVGNIDDGCSVGPFHVPNEGLFSLRHNLAAAGNIQVTDESAIFCFHSFPRSSFLQRARRWIKPPLVTPHRVFPVKQMWNHLAFSLANAQRADSARSKRRLPNVENL